MKQILAKGAQSQAEQAELVKIGNDVAPMYGKLILNAKRPNPDLNEKTEKAIGDWGTDVTSFTAKDWLGRHRAAIAVMQDSVNQLHKDALEGGKEVKGDKYTNEKGLGYRGYKYITPATTLQKVE